MHGIPCQPFIMISQVQPLLCSSKWFFEEAQSVINVSPALAFFRENAKGRDLGEEKFFFFHCSPFVYGLFIIVKPQILHGGR